MLGFAAFIVSIVSVAMSFFANLRLPSFLIAIMGIIVAVIAAYYKDKKELSDHSKKDSRALEVGAIILSGATCVVYFLYLILAEIH